MDDLMFVLGWGSPIGIGVFLLCLAGFPLCLAGIIFLLTSIKEKVEKFKKE